MRVKTRGSTKNIGGVQQGLRNILLVERAFYENKIEEPKGGSTKIRSVSSCIFSLKC